MPAPAALPLPSGVLHLWCCFVADVPSPAHLEACRAWLDPEEQGRAARFVFEKDRTLYLLAHALVRSVLGEQLGVDGRSLTFSAGEHGRPELSGVGAGRLSFNLSHTQGLVALAVSAPDSCVGVDVEREDPRRSTLDIAERFFSPSEYAALTRLPPSEQPERFFSLWTLKEAYVKARGSGLTCPLDRFSFGFEDLPRLGVRFDPMLKEEESAWRFGLMRASAEHHAAYGLRVPKEAPLEVRVYRGVPLLELSPWSAPWVGRTEGAARAAPGTLGG